MKYFAYGSNMLTRRLTGPSRAPSAVACGIASAPGFVVRFHRIGADSSGKCACSSRWGTRQPDISAAAAPRKADLPSARTGRKVPYN